MVILMHHVDIHCHVVGRSYVDTRSNVSTYHYRVSLLLCPGCTIAPLYLALITVIQEMPPKVSAHDHIAGQKHCF